MTGRDCWSGAADDRGVGWGLFARAQRDLVASLHERAARLETERRLYEAQARDAERRRIAREMHDVLAHRLSLLSVHAGALEFRPDAPAEEIAEAAGVVRGAAHAALQELREVIGVLREGEGASAPAEALPSRGRVCAGARRAAPRRGPAGGRPRSSRRLRAARRLRAGRRLRRPPGVSAPRDVSAPRRLRAAAASLRAVRSRPAIRCGPARSMGSGPGRGPGSGRRSRRSRRWPRSRRSSRSRGWRGRGSRCAVDVPNGDDMPPALGRTAYRIVQEGLTNARKHAPAAAVEVDVRVEEGNLVVMVVSRRPVGVVAAPRGGAVPGTGVGLIGLRERVALAGGALESGPDAAGDFVLRATLPWAGAA